MADATTKTSASSAQITHVSSGASMSSGAFSASSDVATALARTGNLGQFPRCEVAVKVQGTASINSLSQNLYLYRRDLNIDGTSDEGVPNASNKRQYMATLQVPGGTAASWTHFVNATNIPLPAAADCEFYLESGLAVNITAGWTLKVTPITSVGATT